jgi:hypothetical protein
LQNRSWLIKSQRIANHLTTSARHFTSRQNHAELTFPLILLVKNDTEVFGLTHSFLVDSCHAETQSWDRRGAPWEEDQDVALSQVNRQCHGLEEPMRLFDHPLEGSLRQRKE